MVIPFTEKYRPRKLQDICLPERIHRLFSEEVNPDQHYLFQGTSGVGKTTLARILGKNTEFYTINAGLESGIDVIRGKILDFVFTTSVKYERKTLLLDEIDRMTKDAQKSLLVILEQCTDTRIIATCNRINRLLPELISRFSKVDFNLSKKEKSEVFDKAVTRMKSICSVNSLELDEAAIRDLLANNLPDFRPVLQAIQKFSTTKMMESLTESNSQFSQAQNIELYQKLLNPGISQGDLYVYLKQQFFGNEAAGFEAMGTEFLDFLLEKGYTTKLFTLAVVVDKYINQSKSSIEEFTTLVAMAAVIRKTMLS